MMAAHLADCRLSARGAAAGGHNARKGHQPAGRLKLSRSRRAGIHRRVADRRLCTSSNTSDLGR